MYVLNRRILYSRRETIAYLVPIYRVVLVNVLLRLNNCRKGGVACLYQEGL